MATRRKVISLQADGMGVLLIPIFALVAATALAFVCWPLWRTEGGGKAILTAALVLFVLGIGGGAYIVVGHPELALRSLRGPRDTDLHALVSRLAWRVRETPDDPRGWVLLGRGYLTLDDPGDAAAAFRRAILLAPSSAKPALFSAYGEALTMANNGEVSPDAEAAFGSALGGNPEDFAARFYLGQAYGARRDIPHALALWESLLADTPPNAPWRDTLIDRIAMLKGAPQAPDIAAMVRRLADRLHAHPGDPAGWQRLVKAYSVLGEKDRALQTLADARKALASNGRDLEAPDSEARELNLQN